MALGQDRSREGLHLPLKSREKLLSTIQSFCWVQVLSRTLLTSGSLETTHLGPPSGPSASF